MKNKTLLLLMCTCCMIALAACSGNPSPAAPAQEEEVVEVEVEQSSEKIEDAEVEEPVEAAEPESDASQVDEVEALVEKSKTIVGEFEASSFVFNDPASFTQSAGFGDINEKIQSNSFNSLTGSTNGRSFATRSFNGDFGGGGSAAFGLQGAKDTAKISAELGSRVETEAGGFSLQPPVQGFRLDLETSGSIGMHAVNSASIIVSGDNLEGSGASTDDILDYMFDIIVNNQKDKTYADAAKQPHPAGEAGFLLEGQYTYRKVDFKTTAIISVEDGWLRLFSSAAPAEDWDNGFDGLSGAVFSSIEYGASNQSNPVGIELDEAIILGKGGFSVQPPFDYTVETVKGQTIDMTSDFIASLSVTGGELEEGTDSDAFTDDMFDYVAASSDIYEDSQRQPHPYDKDGFLLQGTTTISGIDLRMAFIFTVEGSNITMFTAAASEDEWEAGFGETADAVFQSIELIPFRTEKDASFTDVQDESNVLTVSVPVEWDDVDGSPWINEDGDFIAYRVVASPNLRNFSRTWSTPGVVFIALENDDYSTSGYLDSFDLSDECDYDGREKFSNRGYRGSWETWSDCDGTGSGYVVVAATSDDGSEFISIEMTITSEEDIPVLTEVLNSYDVDLP